MLDRFYYHPLLVGAGKVAMEVEKKIPALRLATEIRAENHRHHVLHWVEQGRAKISVFYGVLLSSVVGLLFADNIVLSAIGVVATCIAFFFFESLASR